MIELFYSPTTIKGLVKLSDTVFDTILYSLIVHLLLWSQVIIDFYNPIIK